MDLLEDAYIAVRYLGKDYFVRSAEKVLSLLKEFRRCLGGGFRILVEAL